MRILIVDDDETMRELLQVTLATQGYRQVTTAASGHEALEIIAEANKPFECFLLDIQMPRMDGIELCERLRNMFTYKKTPVLMITAMNQKSYMDRAFAAGATDYVTKPFDVLELLTRVGLAERLNDEMKAAAEARQNASGIRPDDIREQQLDFADPAEIDEVDRSLSLLAMQNYLYRVPRLKSIKMAAFAIKVPQMRKVFFSLPQRDFRYFLTDLAEVLTESLVGHFEFFSYCGGGIFLFVGEASQMPNTEDIAPHVTSVLNEAQLVLDETGAPMEFDAAIGRVTTPSIFSPRGSSEFLVKAIENAQSASRQDRLPGKGNWGLDLMESAG